MPESSRWSQTVAFDVSNARKNWLSKRSKVSLVMSKSINIERLWEKFRNSITWLQIGLDRNRLRYTLFRERKSCAIFFWIFFRNFFAHLFFHRRPSCGSHKSLMKHAMNMPTWPEVPLGLLYLPSKGIQNRLKGSLVMRNIANIAVPMGDDFHKALHGP
jgi:hypothetical protein